MKKNVLIIGAGGVAQVVAHKCAQHNDVLGDIHIGSRTLSKCDAIIDSVRAKRSLKVPGKLEAHRLDAMDAAATAALIRKTGARPC
jgi:saccharopine dehydrogenase-like NADP-dependent oxidoreductase